MSKHRTIFFCSDFSHWSEEPAGFDERRHFGFCPTHRAPMNLSRRTTPEEVGLGPRHEVQATLYEHKEKL
jgi:hypothetical protein